MFRPNEDRLIEVLLDLVRLSSPSRNERDVGDYVVGRARKFGVRLVEDNAGAAIDGTCGNLVGRVPGRDSPPGPRLLFVAHMDTVEPCSGIEPAVSDGTIRSAGPTILGGDDKVAVAAMLEMMAVFAESTEPHIPVTFCFTVAEEIGLLGARHLELDTLDVDYGLVPDGAGLPGDIIVGAPTHITYRAECRGRAAHAGIAPEDGVNAIQIAAAAISKLEQGRIDDETTANVGVVNGGTATNVVPDVAEVRGEVRSHRPDTAMALIDTAKATFEEAATGFGGAIAFSHKTEYETFRLSEDSPAVGLARAAAVACGLGGDQRISNGGSDASVLNAAGIPTVVLATGTENVHSKEETVYVDRLNSVGRWLLAIVAEATTTGVK